MNRIVLIMIERMTYGTEAIDPTSILYLYADSRFCCLVNDKALLASLFRLARNELSC